MAESSPVGPSSPLLPTPPSWRIGHAVTSAARSCTAFRGNFLVYAVTDQCLAVVDVRRPGSEGTSPEARWQQGMRLYPLAASEEHIAFVAGHSERDLLCVGTTHHGLYVTSLTAPDLSEATKLPRSVTGDCTYGATFLFTEGTNYLAFSSLLQSRPSDPTPHRLSLWNIETKMLLWRGAMSPLHSVCSFPFDLSFAACSGGKVGLFSVQSARGEENYDTPGERPAGVHQNERHRFMVLSRHCSAIEELNDAEYTCCIASPVDGEESYLALTSSGYLVAFNASTGSVMRWMDCKVSGARALCCLGKDTLLLTGHMARFFHAATWEFQGRVRWQDAVLGAPAHSASASVEDRESGTGSDAEVFTSGVRASERVLVLFHHDGAMSFHSIEPKAGTQRLSVRRNCILSLLPRPAAIGDAAEVWSLTSNLWCWWTQQALLFVAPPSCTLVSAVSISSTCATVHYPTGAIILLDRTRCALVAYGPVRGKVIEVGFLGLDTDEGSIMALAGSPTGDVVYALVSLREGNRGVVQQLRRYRCQWGTVEGRDASSRALRLEKMKNRSAEAVLLPAGTCSVVAFGADGRNSGSGRNPTKMESGLPLEDGWDHVVAVQRTTLHLIEDTGRSAAAAERASVASAKSVYTHTEAIQRVVAFHDGLLVAGAVTTVFLRRIGDSRWAVRTLAEPLQIRPRVLAGKKEKDDSSEVCVTVAVTKHAPYIACVCRGTRLAVWQLTDTLQFVSAQMVVMPVDALCCDVNGSDAKLHVWTFGPGNVDFYKLGPVRGSATLAKGPERLLPPPQHVEEEKRGARTPRPGSSRANPAPQTLAQARQQRRTASAAVPSSRELSDRFDQLSGFYACQRKSSCATERQRTPRFTDGAISRTPHSFTLGRSALTTTPKDDTAALPLPHTPRGRDPDGAVPSSPTDGSTSAVEVSALTIDSQLLRAGVAAALAAKGGSTVGVKTDCAVKNGASFSLLHGTEAEGPAPCTDSPPQRNGPHYRHSMPQAGADDVLVRSFTSNDEEKTTPRNLGSPCPKSTSDSAHEMESGLHTTRSTSTSERFVVQARQLRDSLLHVKELLEHSVISDSVSDASFVDAEEADLNELSSLLTTVAAQLQLRQVYRSGEALPASQPGTRPNVTLTRSDAQGSPTSTRDPYTAVAMELARIHAQNARLAEQNRLIMTQLQGGRSTQ